MKLSNTLQTLNRLATQYVKAVLAVGIHDQDYVDAYYGPPEWKEEASSAKLPLGQIRRRATAAAAELRSISRTRMDELTGLRHQYLQRQLQALLSRIDLLTGKKMSFDEESVALYDAAAPRNAEEHFQEIIRTLGDMLPGSGPVPPRFEQYKKGFVIPKDRLANVFTAAITESRTRTQRWITLPEQESFTVEYVTGKSWSGYNWYRGNGHSLIQVNTDLPIFADRAVDLASHEGYPGHHVYNSLLERDLAVGRKWVEFTVYALFSPQSLIAEGTANFGIEMAFPPAERVAFERDVLFPLAGFDPASAERYYAIHEVFLTLNDAGNEAARRYLDGEITRDEAVRWLVEYALMSRERAEQRTRFFDQYRSYVINYNVGQDLVRRYIERRTGKNGTPSERWEEFRALLASPKLPSSLREKGVTHPGRGPASGFRD